MKYKVGDKIRIKSLNWYKENKDSDGRIKCGNQSFVEDMSKYCGQIAKITEITKTFNDKYFLNIDNGFWSWTDEMIEGLVEDEKSLCEGYCGLELKYDKLTIADNICTDKVEIILQDYELKKEGDKWFAVKKKKEYPKTYEECSELLFHNSIALGKVLTSGYNCELLKKFGELLICRDAYWKIAGAEMGLGKSWEPDWKNGKQKKYCIYNNSGYISKGVWYFTSDILVFPTEEMRDAFYENFGGLIEQCKELL